MSPSPKRTKLPLVLNALALSEQDPPVRALVDALGRAPAEVAERLIGAPAVLSRRLRFALSHRFIRTET